MMRHVVSLGVSALAMLIVPALQAVPQILDSTIQGDVVLIRVQDRPPAYEQMYEYNCFLAPYGEGAGGSARCGAPRGRPLTYDGFFDFYGLPPGRYLLYASKPPFFPRETVVQEVVVGLDETVDRDVVLATDYSIFNPASWRWGETFAQTFRAKGTSVIKVSFKVAGTEDGDPIIYEVSVHEGLPGGDQIGPTRYVAWGGGGPSGNLSVAWRAGEVPTVPGHTYHFRIRDTQRSDPKTCALFTLADGGVGYPYGNLFVDGGAPLDEDLFGIVGADNDGTICTTLRTRWDLPSELTFWTEVWGQTFTARGHGLAAADVFGAGGDRGWDFDITFTVHEGGPRGAQIGPAKRMPTAFQAGGLYGAVVYAPGEVPLTPGEVYYIKMDTHGGMNCYRLPEADDYPGGTGYAGNPRGQSAQLFDLDMTILEYAEAAEAPPAQERLDPTQNLLFNGDMELGTPGTSGQIPDGWTAWTYTGSPTYWYGPDYGNGSAGARIIGGAINGTTYIAGYYQKITGLDPSKQYRLAGEVRKSQVAYPWFEGQIGYDPTGQTSSPNASTVRYISPGHGREFFHYYAMEPFSPQGTEVTVWLRARATKSDMTFYVDFDNIVLVEWNPSGSAEPSTVETY